MTFANRESLFQAMKVAIVGVFNTIVSFALFNFFLIILTWAWFPAITLSFTLTTFMSYLINRRWTFDLRNGGVSGRESVSFFGVNLLAYLASVGIMWMAEAAFGPLSAVGSNLALLLAAGLLILPKLAGYRDVVFGQALADKSEVAEAPVS
ncbi:MAG: GtrA family protein [Acidimicrobiia bacterium]